MTSITDRRQHARYPAKLLEVLARSNNDDSQPWAVSEVVAVDFNRFGIALESTQQFGMDEILSLIIYTDDGIASKIQGTVRYCSDCDVGFRYGIHFTFTTEEENAQTKANMANMERIINPL